MPTGRPHRDRRFFADDSGAMHNAALGPVIERCDGMHRTAVVPHNDIVLLPMVAVDKSIVGGVGDQLIEQRATLRTW